jgi:hypothetical protein
MLSAMVKVRRRDVLGAGLLGAGLLLACIAGCAAPTLPLPPPSEPTIAPQGTAGTYRLSSDRGAQGNAIIVIVNRNPDVPRNKRVSGAQADPEGTWEAEVIASPGDALDITQEFGTTRSPSITVVVPKAP